MISVSSTPGWTSRTKKKIKDEQIDILKLVAIATGRMGMSIDDFCRCTPSLFAEIHEAYVKKMEMAEQSLWERTRMECLFMLQPYSKKTLKASDVMTFPWDKKEPIALQEKSTEERFEYISKLWQ